MVILQAWQPSSSLPSVVHGAHPVEVRVHIFEREHTTRRDGHHLIENRLRVDLSHLATALGPPFCLAGLLPPSSSTARQVSVAPKVEGGKTHGKQ